MSAVANAVMFPPIDGVSPLKNNSHSPFIPITPVIAPTAPSSKLLLRLVSFQPSAASLEAAKKDVEAFRRRQGSSRRELLQRQRHRRDSSGGGESTSANSTSSKLKTTLIYLPKRQPPEFEHSRTEHRKFPDILRSRLSEWARHRHRINTMTPHVDSWMTQSGTALNPAAEISLKRSNAEFWYRARIARLVELAERNEAAQQILDSVKPTFANELSQDAVETRDRVFKNRRAFNQRLQEERIRQIEHKNFLVARKLRELRPSVPDRKELRNHIRNFNRSKDHRVNYHIEMEKREVVHYIRSTSNSSRASSVASSTATSVNGAGRGKKKKALQRHQTVFPLKPWRPKGISRAVSEECLPIAVARSPSREQLEVRRRRNQQVVRRSVEDAIRNSLETQFKISSLDAEAEAKAKDLIEKRSKFNQQARFNMEARRQARLLRSTMSTPGAVSTTSSALRSSRKMKIRETSIIKEKALPQIPAVVVPKQTSNLTTSKTSLEQPASRQAAESSNSRIASTYSGTTSYSSYSSYSSYNSTATPQSVALTSKPPSSKSTTLSLRSDSTPKTISASSRQQQDDWPPMVEKLQTEKSAKSLPSAAKLQPTTVPAKSAMPKLSFLKAEALSKKTKIETPSSTVVRYVVDTVTTKATGALTPSQKIAAKGQKKVLTVLDETSSGVARNVMERVVAKATGALTPQTPKPAVNKSKAAQQKPFMMETKGKVVTGILDSLTVKSTKERKQKRMPVPETALGIAASILATIINEVVGEPEQSYIEDFQDDSSSLADDDAVEQTMTTTAEPELNQPVEEKTRHHHGFHRKQHTQQPQPAELPQPTLKVFARAPTPTPGVITAILKHVTASAVGEEPTPSPSLTRPAAVVREPTTTSGVVTSIMKQMTAKAVGEEPTPSALPLSAHVEEIIAPSQPMRRKGERRHHHRHHAAQKQNIEQSEVLTTAATEQPSKEPILGSAIEASNSVIDNILAFLPIPAIPAEEARQLSPRPDSSTSSNKSDRPPFFSAPATEELQPQPREEGPISSLQVAPGRVLVAQKGRDTSGDQMRPSSATWLAVPEIEIGGGSDVESSAGRKASSARNRRPSTAGTSAGLGAVSNFLTAAGLASVGGSSSSIYSASVVAISRNQRAELTMSILSPTGAAISFLSSTTPQPTPRTGDTNDATID